MVKNQSDDFDGDDVRIEGEGYEFESMPPMFIDPVTGCWIPQTRERSPKGYVVVAIAGKTIRLHRFIYAAVYGSLTKSEVVRHSCDTRDCCNPAHLLKGSQLQNIADRDERGRTAAGGANGRAKLTDAQAAEAFADKTLTPCQKAQKFGVSLPVIERLLAGESYRKATAPFRELPAAEGSSSITTPR